MISFITIIFFCLGLIVGSFLNVVILRYNTQKNLGGRSACMVCQNTLSWYDLVPLFSYCALKGRCRNCKTKISIQYPIVEFLTALLFAFLFQKFQYIFFTDIVSFALTYAYYILLFSLLLVISVYDIKHKIIPDKLSLFFGVFAFVGMFFFDASGLHPHMPSAQNFLSGLVISVPFSLFWLISGGRWMGLGDAKLAVGLGFLLGFFEVILATMFAFWIGAIVGVFLLALRKISGIKSEIPFAPFLVIGAIIVFMCKWSLLTSLFYF